MRRIRTQPLTRTSSSAISVPSTIVRPTFAAVKTTVRSSVCQKTRSCSTSVKFVQADGVALVRDQLGEPVLLEREPDEAVERVPEDRREDDDHREDQEVRDAIRGRRASR